LAAAQGSWPGILVTALACLAAGYGGIIFTGTDHFFSPIWPLSGVAVGCLLLGGPKMAVGIYAGVAALNALWGMNALTTWVGAAGIMLESLAAYGLLVFLLGPRPRLEDLRGCFAFLLAAPWLPAAANGLLGFSLLRAEATSDPSNFAREWPLFVMANGGAIALLSPAFAIGGRHPMPRGGVASPSGAPLASSRPVRFFSGLLCCHPISSLGPCWPRPWFSACAEPPRSWPLSPWPPPCRSCTAAGPSR
jgi:integral membrane sensor domain MASE1